jgi:predicted outer membrane repeat protein
VRVAALAALIGAPLLLNGSPASAITVSTELQLRAAFAVDAQIDLANSITLEDCTATGGDLDRSSTTALTLDGRGFTITQKCAGQRVMEQSNTGALTLVDVTVTGGTLTGDRGGGVSAGGNLTLLRSIVTGNSATLSGGGIYSGGNLEIDSSTVSSNTTPGDGGGILAQSGTVKITDSTLRQNDSGTDGTGGGGAMFRDASGDAAVTVTRSTLNGNTGANGAGGISALQDLTVVNSTVTGNSTNDGPNLSGENLTLRYSTVVQNTAPDDANAGTVGLFQSFGSVVALPLGGGDNCFIHPAGMAVSNGYNFSDDTSCKFTTATDREGPGNNPLLGPLAGNGGPTETRLPASGSPLIDAIALANCGFEGITTDQRGVSRPQGPGCDIGSVEVEVNGPGPPGPNGSPGPPGPSGIPSPARAVAAAPRFTA